MLIVHEVMGRACGYLTAQAAEYYQKWHAQQEWLPSIGHRADRWDIHAVFLPELALDIDAEAERLKKVMDETGCVNIFLSEGDRKSTRLNSSHVAISYAVFCLQKKINRLFISSFC